MKDTELIAMYTPLDKTTFSYEDLLNFMYLARQSEISQIEDKIRIMFGIHKSEVSND